MYRIAARCRQFKMCETDINGDAAPFFFFETVGIDAGQRLYQRSLAVVNVSRRSYNDRFHEEQCNLLTPCLDSIYSESLMPNLVTVARYRDLAEALLVQGKLESAGIESELTNAETIRTDWLLSNAIGGVGLQVNEDDLDAAQTLLGQSIPESISDEASGETYDQPRCPRCSSLDVQYGRRNNGVFISWIALGLPLPIFGKLRWECSACGAEWIDIPDNAEDPRTEPGEQE